MRDNTVSMVNTAFTLSGVNSALPQKKISILRNPIQPGEHRHVLGDSYLDNLIKKNIIEKHPRGHVLALEVRALINSLSEDNQRKFIEILKAFELDKDKKNLDLFIGEIWSGGGMRVIAGSAARVLLCAIGLLAGLKPHAFMSSSAGSFQAISRVFNSLNSQNLNQTIEAPYHTFSKNRRNLEDWANQFMMLGYQANFGRNPDDDLVRGRHVRETGKTFDVMVGELSHRIFPFNYFFPDRFPLLAELESRFGRDPDDFPIAEAIGATTYFPGLMFNPFDRDFGDHFTVDSDNEIHHLFDPGLTSKYRTPTDPQIEEINRYKRGKVNKPAIYFVIDYDLPSRRAIRKLKKQGGIRKEDSSMNIDKVINIVTGGIDFVDNLLNRQALDRLKEIGTQRTYIKLNPLAIDPYTKQIAVLDTGNLDAPKDVRETVISANIPTSDFQDTEDSVIDQLHRNLVDREFILSGGINGKSAYNLILSDVNKAIGKDEDTSQSSNYHRAIVSARSAAAL